MFLRGQKRPQDLLLRLIRERLQYREIGFTHVFYRSRLQKNNSVTLTETWSNLGNVQGHCVVTCFVFSQRFRWTWGWGQIFQQHLLSCVRTRYGLGYFVRIQDRKFSWNFWPNPLAQAQSIPWKKWKKLWWNRQTDTANFITLKLSMPEGKTYRCARFKVYRFYSIPF